MLADVVFEIQGEAQLIQSAFYGFDFYLLPLHSHSALSAWDGGISAFCCRT